MASKNKYVIRMQLSGKRRRYYFTSKREAAVFARFYDLPQSQIKVL